MLKFKAGDIVKLNEKGKQYFTSAHWLKPEHFVVEDICKAADWCFNVKKNQIAVNVFDSERKIYYSLTDRDMNLLELYIEPFEDEWV